MLLRVRDVLRFVLLRCVLLRLRLTDLCDRFELDRFSLWLDLANTAELAPMPRASASRLERMILMHYQCTAGVKDRSRIMRW